MTAPKKAISSQNLIIRKPYMEINFKGRKRKYQLSQDERQYILYEVNTALSGKHEGEQLFNPLGYYSKIENMLEKVLNLEILDADAKSFKELFKAISEAKTFIGALVSDKIKTA
jgi:hypothetical protein